MVLCLVTILLEYLVIVCVWRGRGCAPSSPPGVSHCVHPYYQLLEVSLLFSALFYLLYSTSTSAINPATMEIAQLNEHPNYQLFGCKQPPHFVFKYFLPIIQHYKCKTLVQEGPLQLIQPEGKLWMTLVTSSCTEAMLPPINTYVVVEKNLVSP